MAGDVKKTRTVKGPKEEIEKVHIFEAWCKRCNICIAFCPTGALAADKEGLPVLNSEKCTQCGMCELRCPDFAITVTPKKTREEKS